MSQNNGGLNWDQVQAPNFSGISQAQIAAAKMLDDAIGQGNKLNLAIGQGRSDEQEKNLLLNLSKYGKGEDALAAMNSGSLLDGINIKALSAEALRNLQKDIGGLYDLENKGIMNTQGYLNHDLTKANTGNVKANTASTYQSMKQSADTHRNTQNQREYENWYARNTNGMNSQQIEEFNRSDVNTNAIQQFGVGFNTIDSANTMLNNRVNTQGNLHTGTKQEAEAEGYHRAKGIRDAYNSIFAGASTTGEITKKVNDDITQEQDPKIKQEKRRIANELGVDTSYSDVIDNSAIYNPAIPSSESTLFDSTMGTMVPQQQQQQPEASVKDSILYKGNGQTSSLFDTSMDQVKSSNAVPKNNIPNYAEEVKNDNVTISSDPKEVLTPTYTSKIDAVRDKIAGVKEHADSLDFSIDDISAAAKSAIPDLTFSQYQSNIVTDPMSGVSTNMNANQTPPISSGDMYRLSKELGKEVMDLPMSAENVAYLNNELKKLDSSPNSNAGKKREEANKRKREEVDKQIEEGARKYVDQYAKEAQSLGLTNQEVAQYAYNNARLRAANELAETQNAGNIKGAEGVEKTKAKIGNWYENISKNPTQFTQQLSNEVNKNLSPAIALAMGPSYFSETALQGVSNERTSVTEALIENNKGASLKFTDVESDLNKIMTSEKVDARTAGYLLTANGMKYDSDKISELFDSSKDVTSSATITALNADKSNIDELIKVSGELAITKSQIANSTLSPEIKEEQLNIVNQRLLRALEELEAKQQSFLSKYNNLKGE